MVTPSFTFSPMPNIIFGIGSFVKLPEIILSYGNKTIIITGHSSFYNSGYKDKLFKSLRDNSVAFTHYCVSGEPSVEKVDEIVFENENVDIVVSIGGGSVLDTGKAVSAMLGKKQSVLHYLEGVGDKTPDGSKVPFIAVPTTAGTGSEATKNAVISRIGPDGFKKSLRHDNFVPDVALLDPDLTISCPYDITAACGMDAFVQLLESYVSTKASPMTDALSCSGLKNVKEALIKACTNGNDIQMRTQMMYASLMSGITLANAGLGIVHGLASPIGGYFDIPHGVVCGTLIGASTKINIKRSATENKTAYEKYARVGELFSDEDVELNGYEDCCRRLVETLERWIQQIKIPRLGEFGIKVDDLGRIAAITGNKNNPVELSKEEIKQILQERL